ncbi:MAG: APC family permease [Oscillospiraceae bacterium]|jgi:APA family basic amino acid/polyamine antiporter|nr:APC family permease [Oscillospiraceae bacterium]
MVELNDKSKRFNLFSTITMMMGVVIGSGIFFKTNSILAFTHGSIVFGILAFCIAGISIIFGSLTIAELATRTEESGGVVAFADVFVNRKFASIVGWINMFGYFPAIISTEAYICGMLSCQLFGMEPTLNNSVLIGSATCIFFMVMNMFPGFGGRFQNVSTVLKFIPLITFILVGIFKGDPGAIQISEFASAWKSTFWLAAVSPIAFAFEGWLVAATITNEIKNPKKTIPLAFTIAPLIILCVYILYFIGVSMYLDPQQIAALGSAHIQVAASRLWGVYGAKILLGFVVLSIMGAINGNIMGALRFAGPLAERDLFPAKKMFISNAADGRPPIASFILFFVSVLVVSVVNYVLKRFDLIGLEFDFSEFSIAFLYVLYAVLYTRVMKLKKTGEIKSAFKGFVCPVLAILGAFVMIVGGVLAGASSLVPFLGFLTFLIVIVVIANSYGKKPIS